MLLEYVDRYNQFDISDKHLTYNLRLHEADSEESFLGLGIASNNKRTWFDFSSRNPEVFSAYMDYDILFAVEVRLDKDVQHYNRSIYTFTDVLGDIGGLLDALKAISSWFMAIFFSSFGNPMHKHLLKNMFLRNPKQKKDESPIPPMNDEQRYKLLYNRTNIKLSKVAFTCLRS